MKVSSYFYKPVLRPCRLKNLDYQVDPYIGCQHYCYYCYALEQMETDWTQEILMHSDIISQLSKELDSIIPQTIYMGYKTDPYQPCETVYCQTQKVLNLLFEKGFSASILTKSNLIVRDIDILKKMARPAVSISVAFNDDATCKLFEYNTMDTEARIDILRRFQAAGIRTGALICPVIPYITDVMPLIDLLEPYSDVIWIYGLNMENHSDRNWQNIQRILKAYFSSLEEKIEAAVFSKNHLYWTQLREMLEADKKNRQSNINIKI